MPQSAIHLFSTDLDGTLLGNPESSWRFERAWQSLDRETRPLLVYNAGRNVPDVRAIVTARRLPEPDHIIGALGTESGNSSSARMTNEPAARSYGWNLERVEQIVGRFAGVQRRSSGETAAFRSSWVWVRARPDDLSELQELLRSARIEAQVVYSCRYFLDVIPAWAGKGRALARLCERLQIRLNNVLVAGDTAADAGMFQLPGVRGIVVGNALPELLASVLKRDVFVAPSSMADGILEGLQHYGIVTAQPWFDGASGSESLECSG